MDLGKKKKRMKSRWYLDELVNFSLIGVGIFHRLFVLASELYGLQVGDIRELLQNNVPKRRSLCHSFTFHVSQNCSLRFLSWFNSSRTYNEDLKGCSRNVKEMETKMISDRMKKSSRKVKRVSGFTHGKRFWARSGRISNETEDSFFFFFLKRLKAKKKKRGKRKRKRKRGQGKRNRNQEGRHQISLVKGCVTDSQSGVRA